MAKLPHDMMDLLNSLLKPWGWYVNTINVTDDGCFEELEIKAFAMKPVNYSKVCYDSNQAKSPICECGALVSKTTHSSWCPLVDKK